MKLDPNCQWWWWTVTLSDNITKYTNLRRRTNLWFFFFFYHGIILKDPPSQFLLNTTTKIRISCWWNLTLINESNIADQWWQGMEALWSYVWICLHVTLIIVIFSQWTKQQQYICVYIFYQCFISWHKPASSSDTFLNCECGYFEVLCKCVYAAVCWSLRVC